MQTVIDVLQILGIFWFVIGVLAVIFMVYIAVEDEMYWRRTEQEKAYKGRHAQRETPIEKAKRELREDKEREAREDSFFNDYIFRGFFPDGDLIHRGHKVPTERALDYYRQMEAMDDTQTMKVFTEEI